MFYVISVSSAITVGTKLNALSTGIKTELQKQELKRLAPDNARDLVSN
jgi:hypothetical protein